METTVPFSGFYESKWTQMLDSVDEREIEHMVKRQTDTTSDHYVAEPLERLDASEVSDALYWTADYSAAYELMARDYVEAFDELASDELGFPLRLKFSVMTSPKFYNFETDRIFATITKKAVRQLFAMSKAEGHATLRKAIAERFTSYDGFISFYSNDLDVWLDKPLMDWDCNEVGTLLMACFYMATGEPWSEAEWHIYESMAEDDYRYWEAAMDFDEMENQLAAKRAEKREDAIEQGLIDPDVPPPYRCPFTPDLFN